MYRYNSFLFDISKIMKLTVSLVIDPTNNGPNSVVIFAKLLVIPINVPAKFGAKSIWLVIKPVMIPLLRLRAIVNKTVAPVADVLNKKGISAKAPPQ